jgi:hypothetical protein
MEQGIDITKKEQMPAAPTPPGNKLMHARSCTSAWHTRLDKSFAPERTLTKQTNNECKAIQEKKTLRKKKQANSL